MEDWLKCQISPLVKYRQNPKNRLECQQSLLFFSTVMELCIQDEDKCITTQDQILSEA